MNLFKSKAEKEFDKKMAIKKTISEMNKQIEKLEKSEEYFLDVAKKAKEQNLPSQLTLAINALKSTIAQKKKVQEMLLNFQIMTHTKDILVTTSELLKGMSLLSKDMAKLCNDKEFAKVSAQFEKAMMATEAQTERVDTFLENSKDSFKNITKIENGGKVKDEDIYAILDAETNAEETGNEELDDIQKKLKEKLGE